jgi:hypothetical protein
MNEPAPYKLILEDRGEYLYALASGELLTPEISRQYWDEIADECLKLGKTKIMIEKDFAQSVSAPEMLSMGVYLGNLLPGKEIAFLDRHPNEDVNELGKKIARNQGVKMQIFKNASDAEKWLFAIN